jgi:hypothetical protein
MKNRHRLDANENILFRTGVLFFGYGWRAFNYIEKGDIAPLGIVLLRLDVMVGERRGFGSAR